MTGRFDPRRALDTIADLGATETARMVRQEI